MKQGIHPEYVECTVRCSCGNTFKTRSTKPEITVELCNECHPFYTGQQKFVDTGGRVQRFADKFGGAAGRLSARPPRRPLGAAAAAEAVAKKAAGARPRPPRRPSVLRSSAAEAAKKAAEAPQPRPRLPRPPETEVAAE